MTAQVRVVLAALPPLLGGIVRRLLAAEPGIAVVAEASLPSSSGGGGLSLAEAVRRHRPHAVIVEMDDGALPPSLCLLFCEFPGLTWIALSRDHSRAAVHVLRREPLPDLGPRDLVSAIRAAGQLD